MAEDKESHKEIIKTMYDRVCAEIDRCRNWHITYLGVSTGLYGAIIGGLKLSKSIDTLSDCIKWGIASLIAYFTIYSIIVIKKQHNSYKSYRETQRSIQQYWKINEVRNNDERVFPKEWTSDANNIRDYGWIYYASYSVILGIISIVIIFLS